jgi:hypothetical protein
VLLYIGRKLGGAGTSDKGGTMRDEARGDGTGGPENTTAGVNGSTGSSSLFMPELRAEPEKRNPYSPVTFKA